MSVKNVKSETTNFTFKIDKKTRERYNNLCDEFGLSMSSATLALIRQAVRSQSMTFTPAESAELKRRIDDVRKGNITEHQLTEV